MSLSPSTIPVGVVVVLGVLVVIQVTLDVIALLDLYRRPVDQVVFANKWIWVAIILMVSTLGPIVYLMAGRRPPALTEHEAPSASASVHPEKVADTLYGPRDGTDRR